jgi:hypothetical protein
MSKSPPPLPPLPVHQYQERFRMSEEKFDVLCKLLKPNPSKALHAARLVLVYGHSMRYASTVSGSNYRNTWARVRRFLSTDLCPSCGSALLNGKPIHPLFSTAAKSLRQMEAHDDLPPRRR